MQLIKTVIILMLLAELSAPAVIVPDLAACADIHRVGGALVLFQLECGRCPSQKEGLAAFKYRPADIPESNWRRCLTEIPLRDPWGHPYIYRFPGIHNRDSFDLYSLGEDGISKTGGSDADDINNWDESRTWDRYYSEGRTRAVRRSEAFDAFSPYVSVGIIALLLWYRQCKKRRQRYQTRDPNPSSHLKPGEGPA